MQPYLFPYLGYFQLIHESDIFVFYDDVNFIKQGWVNRNRILLNKKDTLFTVPVKKISSFNKICNTEIHSQEYGKWREKFLKTIELEYKKASDFYNFYPVLNEVIMKDHLTIADLAKDSILAVLKYLGINTNIINSSTVFSNDDISGEKRVLDICKQVNASRYINVPGGRGLYNQVSFKQEKIKLNFIKPILIPYNQVKTNSFVPGLSIIDILMNCNKVEIYKHLMSYELE